jgi:DNA-binding transcriptional LysR family regulator
MDRLDAWATFLAVADKGSFVAAARKLGRSPQSITRTVAALEEQLTLRLLNRTTRCVSLTDVGQRYSEHVRRLIAEYEGLEAAVAAETDELRGEIYLTAPIVFGRIHALPIVCEFIAENPAIDVKLTLDDRVVPLADEGIDVAFRIGELPNSSLRAIQVGHVRRCVYASPSYLEAHGRPAMPSELAKHRCIAFTGVTPVPDRWAFVREGASLGVINVRPHITVNTAEAAIDATLRGIGLTRLHCYMVESEVREGKLVRILEDHEPPAHPINVVRPSTRHYPRRVSTFVAFAAKSLRMKFGAPQNTASVPSSVTLPTRTAAV